MLAFYLSPLEHAWTAEVDALFYTWGDGGGALWPSKFLGRVQKVYPKWWNAGIDPVEALVQKAHAQRLEIFFSHRVPDRVANRTVGTETESAKLPVHQFAKEQHPEWVMRPGPVWAEYWNFAVQGVRDFKMSVLLEAAEQYDFDAI